jgi:methionyl-tRNA formyltransferase
MAIPDDGSEGKMPDRPRFAVIAPTKDHWFAPHANRLATALTQLGDSGRYDHHRDAPPSDVAYLLSYPRIVPANALARHGTTVVAHASALPAGKGMSPMPWQILEGARNIPITLFKAVPELDAGPVYLRSSIHTRGNELLPELQAALADEIVRLCLTFAERYPTILDQATPQTGASTTYRTRTPTDSELDPHRTIAEQFDLLRIVDNERYPAFFHHRGRRYRLKIEADDQPTQPTQPDPKPT